MKGSKKILNVIYIAFFFLLSLNLTFAQESVVKAVNADMKVISSGPASPKGNAGCFLSSMAEVKTLMNAKIAEYRAFLQVNESNDVREFLEAVQVLGTAEGRMLKNADFTDKDAQAYFQKVQGKFSFAKDAAQLLTRKKTSKSDFDAVFAKVNEQIVALASKKHLATHYVESLKRLRNYVRKIADFNENYKTRVCLPALEEVKMLNQLVNDPKDKNFPLFAQSTKCKCETTTDYCIIDPFDFERYGVALAFFSVSDPSTLPKDGQQVLYGFVNNQKKVDYKIIPGDKLGTTVHKFVLGEKTFEFELKAKCTDVNFVLMSWEVDNARPNGYKFTFTFRSLISKKSFKKEFSLNMNDVENLKIQYIKPYVQRPWINKNFVYTEQSAASVLASLANDNIPVLQQVYDGCRNREQNCGFFSVDKKKCLRCSDSSFEFESKCVSTCPNGTYIEKGSCKKCSTGCELCSAKDICNKCAKDYLMNRNENPTSATCVTVCPTNKYNKNGVC